MKRWNWASDLTSSSPGWASSASRVRMRGIFIEWESLLALIVLEGKTSWELPASTLLFVLIFGGGVDGLLGLETFMLPSLSTLSVELFDSEADTEEEGSDTMAGVLEPESTEGGLSVHILSLSLSDSSPASLGILVLYLRERGSVNEIARGL